jgi:WD repeat-containing protein 35
MTLGNIVHVSWNERHHKLTSADVSGSIVVWGINNKKWVDEMNNAKFERFELFYIKLNRGKAAVSDFKWSSDGEYICIAYDDGLCNIGVL